jgi:hypothetical protein
MSDMASPRTLVGAVRRSVTADVEPCDAVLVALAETYARRIDAEPAQLAKLGPLLLAALDALRMTPRSRATPTGKGRGDAGQPVSPLDQLRARRGARTDGAAALDAAPA